MANTAIRLGYISTSGGGGGGIVEYANLAAFPAIGQGSLVYLALDTKKIYKWSSGAYLLISPSEVTSVNTEVGDVVLDKADIGLGNVDNTSDADKPISDDTQAALDDKVAKAGDTMSGALFLEDPLNSSNNTQVSFGSVLMQSDNGSEVAFGNVSGGNLYVEKSIGSEVFSAEYAADQAYILYDDGTGAVPFIPTVDEHLTTKKYVDDEVATKEPTITAGTTSEYWRGDKTFQTLDKAAVGLSNVDNTSDADKPISSATQTALNAKVETSLVGAINGVASLDGTGKVPSTQLPSYVDDVVEYANLAAFPVTGETSKIYVALDTNKCYRWSGSAYVEISPSEVNSVAGKTGIVLLVKADVGLSNVDNTSDANKPISTATQTALNAKEDSITTGTTSQYWRGDKTFQTLDKSAVGLSNVDNTSDADKPISSATQTALNGKANSPHVHALSDLTQSAATNGQVPSWNGTNWVPSTPATVITDHTLLSNIGTNTHANIDTHIAATSAVHGVAGSVVGTSDSQALTNKTIDADLNTLSNIENADIKAAAAIARTKLASGTANRIVINDGTGVMADAAAITASRALVSDASGIPTASAVTSTELGYVSGVTSAIQTQIGAKQDTITGAATTVTTADLTASRAVVSDATGKIVVSTVTSTEIGYLSGVTSAIQTQINGKQNSLGFTPEDVANKSTTTSLGTSDTLYPTQNAVKTYVDNAVTGGATPDATTLIKGKVKLAGDLAGTADLPTVPGLATKEPTITATTSADYYRGDKTFQPLNKAAVGLSNVDNTSDADKPVSSATQTALNAKENSITAGTTGQYWRGDKSFQTLDKTAVGLSNVDNTSDADKPISSATQTALNAKYDASNPSNYVNAAGAAAAAPVQSVAGKTGIVTLDKTDVGLSNVDNTSDLNKPISTATQTALNGKENTITAGTTGQYYRGDKTFQTLDKTAVGLANVDNTSDLNKPISTATQTALNAKVDNALVGAINGVASLDGTGKVPSTQLPSYVDDVLEFANFAAFPVTGESGKIYVTLDTNLTYRWSGSIYVEISVSLALGETSSTAYRGDRGKTAYDHSQIVAGNPHGTTKSDVGLSNVPNVDATDPANIIQTSSYRFVTDTEKSTWNGKENAITAGTTSQYWRGDKSFQTLDKTAVGLANVDNTSDLDKPISTATATALSGKANTAHVHALSDLTQSSATSGQIPSWNGTNWVPVTPSSGVTDHTLLTNIGTNTHAQIDAFMANTTNVYTDTKEPTGFFSRTTTTLSFDNGTRNFSITPTGATFDVWVKGVKYIKTGAQTIQIPALPGNHFIYFDATGSLGTTQAAGPELFIDNALVSIIYWNTDTNTRTYFAEERHGMQMDGATHSYLHTVFGAQFISGLALQGFSVDGDGSLDAHAQFTSDSGTIKDEDITITISAQTQIPVLYRQGLLWRKKAADAFPFIYSGTAGYTGAAGRIPYNQFTGGAWQLTEIANNAFVLVHLFGTNDIENPVVAIQGTATYGNVTAARLAASSEITSLSGLPFAEFVALGSVVLESSNTYSNTPQAIVRSVDGTDYVDFRGTQLYTPAGEVSTHGLLSGLSSDDHLQYHTDARGDIRYYTKAQVDTIIAGITSPGDLDDTAFSFANNQSAAANVTGFAFANATVRSFKALVSVSVDATTDLFEVVEIEGIHKGSEWDYSISTTGDVTGVVFSITSTGQIQYTSPSFAGFVSGTIKFRALTTAV